MPKLPQIKPKEVEKILLKLGFIPRQGKGSHVVFKHLDGRRTVVPTHKRPVRTGTFRAILRQIDLSAEEFLSKLKK